MKIRVEGADYEFDDSTLLVEEARLIKKYTGMGLKSFTEASKDGDPDALVAIVYLAKRRAGEAIRWQDLDNLDLAKLEAIDETIRDASQPHEAPGADDAADPTWPTGETQNVESLST